MPATRRSTARVDVQQDTAQGHAAVHQPIEDPATPIHEDSKPSQPREKHKEVKTAESSIILEHQSAALPREHATTLSKNRLGPDKPFYLNAKNIHIHERLMTVLEATPGIALFPWLVNVIDEPRRSRKTRIKEGDQRFAKSASKFLGWPLDKRRIRMGLFSCRSGNQKIDLGHDWSLAVVNSLKSPKGGVMVIIFDDAGSASLEQHGDGGLKSAKTLKEGQLKMLRKLRQYRYNIKAIYFGGSPWEGRKNRCLESAMRFIEGFSGQMNVEKGKFHPRMLAEWGLKEIKMTGI